jgi:hypothetical protein
VYGDHVRPVTLAAESLDDAARPLWGKQRKWLMKKLFLSRHCIGGLVSKRSLVGSGLNETQAKQFFKKPMKFTFGASGTVQIVDFANFFYGIRLYGDSKDK